jgi:hypothetical protein
LLLSFIVAITLSTLMAEALAIIGGVAASIQLAQIARKALVATSILPGQKSSKGKIRVWLIHSQAVSLVVDELERIFDNYDAITTRVVQQCRQEANELAMLLLRFTRKLSPRVHSATWFIWTHEVQVEAIFATLRNDFDL